MDQKWSKHDGSCPQNRPANLGRGQPAHLYTGLSLQSVNVVSDALLWQEMLFT